MIRSARASAFVASLAMLLPNVARADIPEICMASSGSARTISATVMGRSAGASMHRTLRLLRNRWLCRDSTSEYFRDRACQDLSRIEMSLSSLESLDGPPPLANATRIVADLALFGAHVYADGSTQSSFPAIQSGLRRLYCAYLHQAGPVAEVDFFQQYPVQNIVREVFERYPDLSRLRPHLDGVFDGISPAVPRVAGLARGHERALGIDDSYSVGNVRAAFLGNVLTPARGYLPVSMHAVSYGLNLSTILGSTEARAGWRADLRREATAIFARHLVVLLTPPDTLNTYAGDVAAARRARVAEPAPAERGDAAPAVRPRRSRERAGGRASTPERGSRASRRRARSTEAAPPSPPAEPYIRFD